MLSNLLKKNLKEIDLLESKINKFEHNCPSNSEYTMLKTELKMLKRFCSEIESIIKDNLNNLKIEQEAKYDQLKKAQEEHINLRFPTIVK